MPETCDEPGCTNEPVFTMNIFRRQPAGVVPHFQSAYHDVCADHAVFKAIHAEDFVHLSDYKFISHHKLLQIVKQLPEDYKPWGQVDKDVEEAMDRPASDCSCGCKFYAPLDGDLRSDWGVCTNAQSHRVGLLTFEHQGCTKYEPESYEGGLD